MQILKKRFGKTYDHPGHLGLFAALLKTTLPRILTNVRDPKEGKFMKKTISLLAITALAMPTFAAEYVVKYRNPYSVQSFASTSTVQILDVHTTGQLMKVHIPSSQNVSGLVSLLTDPNVEYVVPNIRIHMFRPIESTDRALKPQWAIDKVQAAKAWARAGNKGSHSVVVAVIDTGIDYKHPNLAPNVVAGHDFAGNDEDPMDETGTQNPGHGTHCAGIIGATGLIDGGTVGVAPDISLMPIRFLDQNGSGDLYNGAKSIDYAIQKQVDVISASWGMTVPAGQESQIQPILDAIGRAEKAGIPFVVAAANDGNSNDTVNVEPANAPYSNVIAIAASDVNDAKPSWSNYGRAKVSIASPGNQIMSTIPGNKYQNLSGTSMATPLVAGLVGLIKSQDKSLTPTQIRSLLQATGQKVSIETACDCRIDAFNAIDVVKSQKMFISPFAATLDIGKTLQFEAVYGHGSLKFSSSNPAVATVDANGLLTAVSNGDTQVTVTDADGNTSTSYKIYVGASSSGGNGGDNGGDGGGGGANQCPVGDAATCQAYCSIIPTLPWCKTN
jgi:thermitase